MILNHFFEAGCHSFVVRPHLAEQLAEHDNTLVCYFEGSDSWNHAVAVCFTVVGNKLAVTVVVRPFLRDGVENKLDLRIETRLYSLFN